MKYREKNILSKVRPEFREKLYEGRKIKEQPNKLLKVVKKEKILIIPKETIGFVIGKNGANIKKIENKYNVIISIDNNTYETKIYYYKYHGRKKYDSNDKIKARNELVKLINQYEGEHEPIKYKTIQVVEDKRLQ